MPSAPPTAAPQRRTQRERRANSRYEDGVDPDDEAALLSGNAPLVGQKRKAAAVFGSALSIPRRARSSRYARDGDSDQSAAGAGHAAAAALQFSGRPVRTGSKRQAAAAPDDQAVAELLLGMGDLITARTDSPTSSSDGGNVGGGGGRQKQQKQQRAPRRRQSARARDQWGDDDTAPTCRLQKDELPPPPPGKRRAAVAAALAIAAAAASDKAPSDDEAQLGGIAAMDTAPPAAKHPLPKTVPRGLTAVMPPAHDFANGDAGSKERSRLAGPVAPADGFDETLRHVHQVTFSLVDLVTAVFHLLARLSNISEFCSTVLDS